MFIMKYTHYDASILITLDVADTDRQQAALQGLWQGRRPGVSHHARGRGREGRQTPRLVIILLPRVD
jgi:hypothetical protein